MKRHSPAPDFNPVAGMYRWCEYLLLGRSLQRCREFFLPHLAQCRRALLLGDGDGRFLEQLLRSNPGLEALALDSSSAMLRRLAQRCASPRVTTRLASATRLDFAPLPAPDLLVSHFFLDCLSPAEVQSLARDLAATARPGALWLVSDFAVPPRQPWKSLGALLIRALYLAFRLLTGLRIRSLPPIEPALRQAGFLRLRRRIFLKGLLFTELWQLQSPGEAPHTTRSFYTVWPPA